MIKKGFTLAEVLITLSIIGVVSALTLPNLSSGYSKQVTATQLSKAINTLENANALALQENFVSDLTFISGNNNYYDAIKGVLKATTRTSANFKKYKRFNEDNLTAMNPPHISIFDTKDGMTFIQTSANSMVRNIIGSKNSLSTLDDDESKDD